MQTKRINLYGVYTVGNISTSSEGNFNLESVLRLTVPMDERVQEPRRMDDENLEHEGKEESKTYSLNDLKTLQSKLMLIAGKTVKLRHKDSMESTEEINRFVEVHVKHLHSAAQNVCLTGWLAGLLFEFELLLLL